MLKNDRKLLDVVTSLFEQLNERYNLFFKWDREFFFLKICLSKQKIFHLECIKHKTIFWNSLSELKISLLGYLKPEKVFWDSVCLNQKFTSLDASN